MRHLWIYFVLFLTVLAYSQEPETCIRLVNLYLMEESPRPGPLPNFYETAHFKIHYINGVTAGYVETAWQAAEKAYDSLVTAWNWIAPPADNNRGGNNKYDIYITANESAETIYERDNPANEGSASFIIIPPGYPYAYLDMKVTHEFAHACQGAYSSNEGEPHWFYENCAVYMAELVWDYAYRYYNVYFTPGNYGIDAIRCPECPINSQIKNQLYQ